MKEASPNHGHDHHGTHLHAHQHSWWDVGEHLFMITGFVFIMMVVIEYLNILTQGKWEKLLSRNRWVQYLLCAGLGASPGCLGAYAVVSLYAHGSLSLGAVVAAMIATSGDEAFVMFALLPPTSALGIIAILFVVGLMAGFLVDFLGEKLFHLEMEPCLDMTIHKAEPSIQWSPMALFKHLKNPSWVRLTLLASLVVFAGLSASGFLTTHDRLSIRLALIISSVLAMFVVASTPEHFVKEHLWNHITLKHLPKLFLWTSGALVLIFIVLPYFQLTETIQQSQWTVLVVAAILGLLPISGPHLVMVTLFAEKTIPLSILLASSIVQDGHGMIPLLAHSRKYFIIIKVINLFVGLLVAALLLFFGW